MPPRPEAPAAPEPKVKVAAIELVVSGVNSAELFAQVQWLAGDGTWVTTDGWRGTLEFEPSGDSGVIGMQHWAVGRSLYGQTEFRWQVFDREGGTLIGTSEMFDMPTRDREVVKVGISAE